MGYRETIAYRYSSGITMADASTVPGHFPEHWHMSAEFILALADGQHFRVGTEEYILKKGDILLIWPTELHEILEATPQGYFLLQFSSELITDCNDLNLCYHHLQSIHSFSADQVETKTYLGERLQRCLQLFLNPETFSEIKIRMRIYEILLYLCETHLGDTSLSKTPTKLNYDTYIHMQKICNYIRIHSGENITQKDAAKVSGYSPYYFSRIFKAYTQESFKEYLTKHRLQNAVTLLYQENMSIQEVAFLAGFQSISNFCKVFRQHMHCTPMEYRKKHRDNTT